MTHRERALAAINREESDRVSLDFGGTGGLMVDPVYFEVKGILGLKEDVPPYRSGSTANYYDERVLEAFDVDFRHLWLASPDKPKSVRHEDGSVTDCWNITWSPEGSYPVFFPLKGLSEREIADFKWPEFKNWDLTELRERARHYYEDTDYCVVAKAVLDGAGILERCYYLRSIDEFFMDLIDEEDLAMHLINTVAQKEMDMWDMYLDAVGPYIHVIQRAADLGTQTCMFISPDLFRKFFKPVEDRVYTFIRSKAPHVKIWYHSCGAVDPIIPDLIDLGVDILNPVQPLAAGMDSFDLKRKYGDKLCFHGGIDLQVAMPGSIEDVRREVRTRIKAMAPGGGYILAPSNHIQKDTPGANVVELYRYAKEVGKFPIEIDL